MIQFKNENAVVFESAIFRTTSTVVLTDDLVLVVDPNWLPGEIERIEQFVAFSKGQRPVYLLFTHSDYDHIIGWKAFPDAKVIASKTFQENPDKQAVIEQILKWDDENYIQRSYPVAYPEVGIVISEDGQTFRAGQTLLTFYLAPGHNPDGIFTIVENGNWSPGGSAIWIAGDYLSNVEFPFIYFSSEAYEKTLSKTEQILTKHAVGLLISGHGDVAFTKAEILNRHRESVSYLETLRETLRQNRPYDTKQLWQRYAFRRGMEKFQEENVKLMQKEMG